MAEDNVISVTDVASKGVVFDTPPVALSPNVFTDARNVRFKDGAIRKIEGELLLNNIASDLTGSGQAFGKVRYFAVWENPNLQPTGCYYIFVVDYLLNSVTVGQKVYIQDHLGTKRDITPTTLNSGNGFVYTTSGWQHTLFTGGFTFIINNGLDKPHYILDIAGNTNIANIVLAELPGWDSYNVDQPVISDVWNSNEQEVFDLGQKVNFVVNSIVVTVAGASRAAEAGTPAGTNTTNASNFLPGVYPGYSSLPTVTASKFQIYTDNETNTTVVYVGGLADGNTAAVNIVSRNPVSVTAGIVESFGNILIAGNLTEKDGNNIVRRLSGVVRTSDVAVPGSVPNNWDPFNAGVSTADEFTLSETNVIQDMKSLLGKMYIYSTDSIHQMTLTGNAQAPVSFGPVTDEYGLITTGGVIEYDGKHFVIGGSDIYLFAGNPGDIASLADSKVRAYFFNNLNPVYEQQLFTILNHRENEIWICYPTLASLAGECDEALIFNYRDQTWTIRDLDSVTAGDVGPIKGGGIPLATVALTGNSGNAGYSNRGKREIQAVTINGSTPKKTVGTKAIKTVTVSNFTTFTTDTLEVVNLALTGTTGPTIVSAISTLTHPSATTFSYDREGTTYADGGASVVISGDSTIGTVSLPAKVVIGTTQADGATITMTILVAAIRDYINANNVLSDWTATATTNVLTMTSVAFGPRTFSTCTISVGGGSPASIVVASIRTGTGVYSITEALSPAISMTITAPAVTGVQAAIDETITFEKGLSAQSAIRDDAVAKLSALSVFNGDANSIYSIGTNSNDVRFISTEGGDHSALTISFKTIYDETDYSETQFGGNLSSTVSVVTAGVDRSVPLQVLTVTFPDGTTSQKTLEGTFTRAQMTAEYNTLANANSGWNTVTDGTSVVTATAATIGIISANFSGSIASLYSGSSPSGVTFTGAQTRAGRSAYNTTDRITLTPPVGNAITIDFDSTTAYNPDSGSSPTNVEGITATEIATALQAAWSDTTYFTVARSGAILTFTGTNRGAITGTFAYTIVNGDTRTGTLVSPLITNSVSGNISTTEGIDRLYGKMTRVTITLNSTTGSTVIFDRHYGEGPGRLLDPDFTAGANDLPYGDSGAANAADYLNLYYDPDKTQSGTELAKPNGTVANTLTAMQAALAAINSNQYVLVVPDSTSSPTSIQISPSQFSSSANYVTIFSPATQVVVSSVAPTTTALTAVAEGNTVATSSPTQSTSGTDINTTFSIVRPWASGLINPTKVFPIFAESGYTSGTLFNRLRAADLGYDFGGTNYISYFERSQMSITPNFDTETVETIALWADGGTIEAVGGEPQRATLQVRSRGTNYSGENAYLTVAEDNTQTNAKKNKLVVNDFVVGSAYKVDTRIQGRFINYRVDDALASTASGYVASNNKAWNISGLQLKVRKGGDR